MTEHESTGHRATFILAFVCLIMSASVSACHRGVHERNDAKWIADSLEYERRLVQWVRDSVVIDSIARSIPDAGYISIKKDVCRLTGPRGPAVVNGTRVNTTMGRPHPPWRDRQ